MKTIILTLLLGVIQVLPSITCVFDGEYLAIMTTKGTCAIIDGTYVQMNGVYFHHVTETAVSVEFL